MQGRERRGLFVHKFTYRSLRKHKLPPIFIVLARMCFYYIISSSLLFFFFLVRPITPATCSNEQKAVVNSVNICEPQCRGGRARCELAGSAGAGSVPPPLPAPGWRRRAPPSQRPASTDNPQQLYSCFLCIDFCWLMRMFKILLKSVSCDL